MCVLAQGCNKVWKGIEILSQSHEWEVGRKGAVMQVGGCWCASLEGLEQGCGQQMMDSKDAVVRDGWVGHRGTRCRSGQGEKVREERRRGSETIPLCCNV